MRTDELWTFDVTLCNMLMLMYYPSVHYHNTCAHTYMHIYHCSEIESMYYSAVHLLSTYSSYPLGITITKGHQFTEGLSRVIDYCCVDVLGQHDYI